jgi:hypothetical protein
MKSHSCMDNPTQTKFIFIEYKHNKRKNRKNKKIRVASSSSDIIVPSIVSSTQPSSEAQHFVSSLQVSSGTQSSPTSHGSKKRRRSLIDRLWNKPDNWNDLKFGADKPVHPRVNILPIKVPLGPKFGEHECMHLLEKYIKDQAEAGRTAKYMIEVSGKSQEYIYYTKESISEMGLKYFQITTRPQTLISDDKINSFNYYIDNVFKSDPNCYILVHCTHGVNRTGFYICNYLARKLSIPVHIALAYFAISRQVALYDPFLIEHLFEINNQKDSEMYREARYPRFDADNQKQINYEEIVAQRLLDNPHAQFKDYSELDDHLNLSYYQRLLAEYESVITVDGY